MINGNNFFQLAGGLLLLAIGGGITGMAYHPNVQASRQAAADILDSEASAARETAIMQAAQATANARYDNNCTLVDSQLSENSKVSGVPLRIPVCDTYGGTGMPTKSGAITGYAFTTEKAVIQGRIAR